VALHKCILVVLAVLFAGACTGWDDPFGPSAALQPGETRAALTAFAGSFGSTLSPPSTRMTS
jgi:hypothetical protein